MAGRQIGAVFIPILKSILPILNGILMAFNTIMSYILGFFGIDASSLASEFGIASSGLEMLDEGLDGISGSAEKAKKSLRGFDKLNNIVSTTSSGGGYGSIAGGGIDKGLLEALDEYNLHLDEINQKATQIRNRILEWLGFTIDANGEINGFHITLGSILASLGLIVGSLKIVSGITKLFSGLKGFLGLGTVVEGTKTVGIIGKLGTFIKGIASTKIGALVTGLGKGAIEVALVYEGLKLLPVVISDISDKLTGKDWDNWGDKLAGTTKETQENLKPVQDGFDNLVKTISNVSYDDLPLTEEEKNKITSSIDDLTATLDEKVVTYIEKQKENAKLLLEQGFITPEQYDQKIKELDGYLETEKQKHKEQGEKLKELTETMYDENGNIIADKYSEYLELLETYENEELQKLTWSEEDKKKIEENAKNYSLKEKRKYYSDLLTEYAKDRDNAIQKANEKYDSITESARNLFGEESAQYKNIEQKARETRDKEIAEANTAYDTIYNDLKTTMTDMGTYIDKDDGHLLSKWEIVNKTFKENWKDTCNTIKSWISGIKDWWNGLSFNKKNIELQAVFDDISDGSIGRGKIGSRADGGFVDTGQMFIAREAGPEMVGTIGGKTAVANNDQIVESISIGVARAMSSVKQSTQPVQIIAEGDTSGLLDFITFKQKEQDRQYGF